MATLFYDHLIDWPRLHQALDRDSMEHAEHIVHTHVLMVFLDNLPENIHEEFLTRFHANPSDPGHFHFLNTHTKGSIAKIVKQRINQVIDEIVGILS